MYKLIAGILLLLPVSATYAQMGIPTLGIGSPAPVQSLTLATLAIESNQVITGLTNCSCTNGCGVVLPVTLLSFEGRRINPELVKLNWKTANEFQNKGFEVQRSLGNITAFRPVGYVPAQTSGAPEYEYELPDNNNYGGTSYYRLKQVDLDDHFTYSETVAVKGYANQASLALYPNPVAEKLVADIFAVSRSEAVLMITDATQKKIYSQPIHLNKGINLVDLPATGLRAGVYFVQVISQESGVLSAKFIRL
jgi:hypothetical protein